MNPLFLPKLQDFLSGVLFCVVGAVTIAAASQHPLGTAMRMGAGYFPLFLGVLLVVFGVTVATRTMLKHLRQGQNIGDFSPARLLRTLRRIVDREAVRKIVLPAALVGVGVLAFAGLLGSVGLLGAILALVVISGAAHHEASWRELLPLGAGLAVFGVGVFVWGLGLPLPVLPT
ncbi:MAG: tripartite tricarboxylate transporter TctB family protein [Azoarcus sp.]|jgi:hypothetical protein|nr:tripartite tricarboxylate transporter TctB family protein [Azoarcus sp.]